MVYENYNKFIMATDTIKKMKKHVVDMEDEMRSLAKTMEEINDCSGTINKNLAEKREKIDKLSQVNRMLKKVRFKLPNSAHMCIFFLLIFSSYSHLPLLLGNIYHPFTWPYIYLLFSWLYILSIYLFTCSLTHSLAHSFTCPLIDLLSFVNTFILLFRCNSYWNFHLASINAWK